MFEKMKRLLRPKDSLPAAVEAFESDIVKTTQVVHEGIQLRFLEGRSGDYLVLASRRKKPFLKATSWLKELRLLHG